MEIKLDQKYRKPLQHYWHYCSWEFPFIINILEILRPIPRVKALCNAARRWMSLTNLIKT